MGNQNDLFEGLGIEAQAKGGSAGQAGGKDVNGE